LIPPSVLDRLLTVTLPAVVEVADIVSVPPSTVPASSIAPLLAVSVTDLTPSTTAVPLEMMPPTVLPVMLTTPAEPLAVILPSILIAPVDVVDVAFSVTVVRAVMAPRLVMPLRALIVTVVGLVVVVCPILPTVTESLVAVTVTVLPALMSAVETATTPPIPESVKDTAPLVPVASMLPSTVITAVAVEVAFSVIVVVASTLPRLVTPVLPVRATVAVDVAWPTVPTTMAP